MSTEEFFTESGSSPTRRRSPALARTLALTARETLAIHRARNPESLICVECGSITEFEEPRIETLQDEIASRYGFDLRTHKHELYGICAACQTKIRRN